MDGKIAHLLFEDESMIRDYQALQHTWFLKGKQRIIQTTGKHSKKISWVPITLTGILVIFLGFSSTYTVQEKEVAL